MEKKYLSSLKKIDTHEIAFSIANRLRGSEMVGDYHSKGIAVAYVLYQAALDNKVCVDNKEAFENSFFLSDSIKSILNKNLANAWYVISELKDKYTADELLAYILFNNDMEDFKTGDCSTPSGVIKLACSILDIQENDKVLELCSGKGNFFTEAFATQENFDYTGVELNYVSNDIAQIRAELLDKNISLILNDAFEYRADEKADKLFANYPFMVKTPAMSEHKETVRKAFDIPAEVVQRASSDWVFNATIVEQMNAHGKAVTIMTNGATWNTTDRSIRQFFIENGFIEAVISLPSKLFNSFSIPTTLIVFSHNNKEIKMIDAREICVKERRNNVLTDDNIKEILSLLEHDEENSITKNISEFSNNEFVLNATRYLEVLPEIANGVELGSVAVNITRGAQLKADDLEEKKSSEPTPYKYLMLANINDGVLSFDEEQYLKGIPANLSKFCVKNNSIVLTRTGLPIFKSAVAKVEKDTALLATGNLFVIELDETKVNPFYVQAFFASEAGVSLFRSICTGTGLPTISLDKLRKLVIPLPSLEEQNVIGNKYAATMDEVILLKRKLEKSIARMKHIYDEEV